MARDPRKASAFDSGMRGSQKPSGGESKQGPRSKVGNPDGEAYSSGMRGGEKPKEQPVEDAAATQATGNAAGAGSSRQGPNTSVGNPKGEDSSKTIAGAMSGKQTQSATSGAYKPDTSNLEAASQGQDPQFEEDDTHLNIRVPKTSFKRKGANA